MTSPFHDPSMKDFYVQEEISEADFLSWLKTKDDIEYDYGNLQTCMITCFIREHLGWTKGVALFSVAVENFELLGKPQKRIRIPNKITYIASSSRTYKEVLVKLMET